MPLSMEQCLGLMKLEVKPSDETPPTRFDYKNQAWIEDGRYVRCGHPDSMDCGCYGKMHEGEVAP